MSRPRIYLAIASLVISLPVVAAFAQFGGSRAGTNDLENEGYEAAQSGALLSADEAHRCIVLEGSAEIRVRPTQLRVVMAATAEHESAKECHLQLREIVARLRKAWEAQGLAGESVVEDFVASLPRYAWKDEKRGNENVFVESKVGYRMQTNLHLLVPDENAAQAAIGAAFEQGITDILAFDYGSPDLDAAKENARQQAKQAVDKKAELLFGGTFKNAPAAVNVQEQTKVHYPETLYESFVRTEDQELTSGWKEGSLRIHAHRPRNTYFRGMRVHGDIQPADLPMRAEITVMSRVRVYYASPGIKLMNKK